ncbi:MAG: response regulator transcription factor [Eubacterium sp.]|nr:response regulator transcription factor [Candidatus Colimonas fimequi]
MSPSQLNKVKIFLVDDHKILRESLSLLLSQEDDFEVIGSAENGMNLENILVDNTPDVLLMDISMPKRDGIDTAIAVKKVLPDIRIIFLTMHKNEEILFNAFSAGCTGYVLKENAFEELSTAVRRVSNNEIFISQELTPMMLKGFLAGERNDEGPSGREHEIIKLLAEGYSNKEIADMLSISVKTVETHRANIMKKYNFKNITELVRYAARHHIIEI